MLGGEKIGQEKHLSPSRRRALCPFFVQTRVVVQTVLPLRPAAGSVACLAIARRARFCKEVQLLCTEPRASGIGDGVLAVTVYRGRAFENRRFAEFSFSESLALGELLTCSKSGINLPECLGASAFSADLPISEIYQL